VGPEREADSDSERWDFRRVTKVVPDHDAERTRVEWAEGLGTTTPHLVLPSANPKVYALRVRASLFGFNAPHPKTLADDTLKHYGFDPTKPIGDWSFSISNQSIDLDATYPGILAHNWLVLSRTNYQELYRATAVVEASRADFTLSGKTTRVSLDTNENLSLFQTAYRDTMVFAQSELLEIAESPYFDPGTKELLPPITGATIQLAQAPSGLVKGQWLVASGKDSVTGEAITETVQVSAIDGTTLAVTPPLKKSYVRVSPKPEESFSLNANVAHATHGETVSEILGSGDASERYQQFTLKQSPLTYVSAATASGAQSTLETTTDSGETAYGIHVNGLRWHEAPTLFGRGSQEHIYVSRTSDDGKTTVEFGDGVTGARLPSGQDNVRATYRKGIGTDGLVKAGQLTSLLTRPLGIKSVVNPEDATGAQDRESLDDAKTNAPLTVLTLDRTVSLQDYEDFSRSFAGIAKALATWTWDGQTKRVFITVAGPDGAEIKQDSDTYMNLLTALQQAGDPFVSLRVKSYRPAYFRFAGKVKIDPDYQSDVALAAVEAALREQFSFDVRAFGQPVFLSEVIAAVQAVPGMIAVDVNKLYRTSTASTLQKRLLAAQPETLADGSLAAAELLTLDAEPLDGLGVMS
jgi:hypothetical protein